MDFCRAFRLSTFVMVSVAILSLALAEGNSLYILLALAGAIPLFLNREISFSPLSNLFVLLFCTLFAIWDYAVATREIILTLAHFLILIQVFKLVSKKTNRDYILIYLVSLLHLAVAGIVTSELSFVLPFVLYMISATWSLILFHVKREAERAAREEGKTQPGYEVQIEKELVSRYFFFGTGAFSCATLVLTALFFATIPRLSAGYLWRTSFRQNPVTGFSEEVNLSFSGYIRQGYEEVMRVKPIYPSERTDECSYFRGVALSHYTGERWLKVSPEILGSEVTDEDEAGAYKWKEGRRKVSCFISGGRRVFPIKSAPTDEGDFIARYWLSRLTTDVLFAVQPVQRIEFFSKESPVKLEVDILGSVYNPSVQFGYIGYDAVSRMPVTDENILNSAKTRALVDSIDYTALPPAGRYFRTRELQEYALKLIRQHSANTPYQMAKAVERGLSQECSYSLSIERTPDVEPVYDFLFNKKKGHCELFASAMTVLLRTVGIPARVVNGYRGSQWNDYGDFFLVRQKDAHCWVEVFFDDDADPTNGSAIGWVTFDPAPSPSEESEGLFDSISRFIAYVRLKWIDHVISYSFEEQVQIALKVRHRTRSVWGWFSSAFQKVRDFFSDSSGSSRNLALRIFLPFFTFVTALGILYHLFRARRKKATAFSSAASPSIEFYHEFVRLAGKVGIRRKPAQTPLEFAQTVCALVTTATQSAAFTFRESVLFLTTSFCQTRYGQVLLPQEQSGRIALHLGRVKTIIRQSKKIR